MLGKPSVARKISAVVAVLVVLSIVLGDTREVGASGIGVPDVSVVSLSSHWAGTDAAPVAWLIGSSPGGSPVKSWRAPSSLDSPQRTIAGIPPWIIWPPSPMPRISGTMVRLSGVSIAAGTHAITRLGSWPLMLPLPPLPGAVLPDLNHLAPVPPARLAGANFSIPRPPPTR
ncbi:MAG: hypothetical protein H0W06_06400 [Chloroflexia bacterium]|nr:hypothetical protein [Chloroflexia bacterium]